MSSEKVGFAGSSQGLLVGVLERPDHAPLQALAVFAHCFTCGKTLSPRPASAGRWLSRASPRCALISPVWARAKATSGAVAFRPAWRTLWRRCTGCRARSACLHCWSDTAWGTAAIAAAARLDGIRAVCTLGAPATADHVLRHFGPTKSEEDGQIQVDLGGRAFRIAPAFIEELQAQAHENPVKGLRAALLGYARAK